MRSTNQLASNRSKAKKVSQKQNGDSLKRVRTIADALLNNLETYMKQPCDEFDQKQQEYCIGQLTKISQILTKTIPMEQQLAENKPVASNQVSDEDRAILERYVQRCIEEGEII